MWRRDIFDNYFKCSDFVIVKIFDVLTALLAITQ